MDRHKRRWMLTFREKKCNMSTTEQRSGGGMVSEDVTYKEHGGELCIQMIYIEKKALLMRLTNMSE